VWKKSQINAILPEEGGAFMERYDSVVIGSGPAGLEAAINLKIRKKTFLLFGQKHLSTKIIRAPKIDNYLGLPSISGQDLQALFLEHLAKMDIALQSEQVSIVYPMGDYFSIASNRETYEAATVILATGAASAAAFPGEERLLGRGVGYCATCDAPLYKGKRVAVVGYSDEAVYEANYVSELADKVFYIPMKKRGADLNESIEEIPDKVLEIKGDASVSELVLAGGPLQVDGVFILRETIAPASLVPGIEVQDGFIRVDQHMATNLPGLFAAGDCTGMPHQYMRAAGQGQTAALSAVAYLDRR